MFTGLGLLLHGLAWPPGLLRSPRPAPPLAQARPLAADIADAVAKVDALMAEDWRQAGVVPVSPAPDLAVARRLSLALTGSIPSVAEIRRLESSKGEDRSRAWLEHLLADPRSSEYLAERFARAFVGVDFGTLVVYRRARFVEWLEEQIAKNRPYDGIVRDLIAAEGVWTTVPAANFLTATVAPEGGKGPDEVKLASRVARAFLGVRIDCVECHDDLLGGPWKQTDFHQLAAFFAPTDIALTGVRDTPGKSYQYRYLKTVGEVPVPQAVPFAPELLPSHGPARERLAAWVTDGRNEAFSRAAVNRVWALLFGRALVDPVDSIPLDGHGPRPPVLDALAADFAAHGHDLRRLIRVIAATRAFHLDSQAPADGEPVSEAQETHWAAFPMSRLRPEQLSGALQQSSTLATIDGGASFLRRLTAWGQGNDFVKRHGDAGEEELKAQPGTIAQSLLMMNGSVIQERTGNNPVMNASSRIAMLAGTPAQAVESAFLAVFTRRPTGEELAHFEKQLESLPGGRRIEALEDLFWMLLNSAEFSWNH